MSQMNQMILESYESKIKITRKTPDDGSTKNVKIAVPLKYLSNL